MTTLWVLFPSSAVLVPFRTGDPQDLLSALDALIPGRYQVFKAPSDAAKPGYRLTRALGDVVGAIR